MLPADSVSESEVAGLRTVTEEVLASLVVGAGKPSTASVAVTEDVSVKVVTAFVLFVSAMVHVQLTLAPTARVVGFGAPPSVPPSVRHVEARVTALRASLPVFLSV